MTCQEPHRYDPFFAELNSDQSNPYRHRCAGCAYELGYNQAYRNERLHFTPESIPLSQAGYVRHKAAEEAFNMGCIDGQKAREAENRR